MSCSDDGESRDAFLALSGLHNRNTRPMKRISPSKSKPVNQSEISIAVSTNHSTVFTMSGQDLILKIVKIILKSCHCDSQILDLSHQLTNQKTLLIL